MGVRVLINGTWYKRVAKATFIVIEILRKNPDQFGFVVNLHCLVVERLFA